MASWNSVPLEITYHVLGWTSFLSWAMCFYPQVISNFCRKRYYYNTNKFPIFFLGLGFVSRYAWLLILFLGFLCWGVCEPSVVGMSFDFVVLNLTKHSFYLIYNASLFFSPTIQKQYYEKYGYGEVCAFFLQGKKHHFKFSTRNRNFSSLGFSMHVDRW